MGDRERKRREVRWEKRPEPGAGRSSHPAFPEGPGVASKPGDPPLEVPHGERSRHGAKHDGEGEDR
jgi:hypothetical protein